MRFVCCKQLQGWNVIEELSANGWIVLLSLFSFSDFAPAISFLFPAVQTILKQRIFYNLKYLKWSQDCIVKGKKKICLTKFLNPKMLLYLTVILKVESVWQFEQYKSHLTSDSMTFWRRIQHIIFLTYWTLRGDRGSTVVKALCYKSEGRWFDPSWCQWIFHWHKILPIALWPSGRPSL